MSSSKCPVVLMATLLALPLACLTQNARANEPPASPPPPMAGPFVPGPIGLEPPPGPPLPGQNSLTRLEVKQDKTGAWVVEFDYFYTGDPSPASVYVDLLPHGNSATGVFSITGKLLGQVAEPARRGKQHASIAIPYPGEKGTTRQIAVALRDPRHIDPPLATLQTDTNIDWPDFSIWMRDQEFRQGTPAQNLARAVAMIDSGAVNDAKLILERLLNQDSRFEGAYIELARVAMKSNWGPEGLHQAETLLSSALQIRPDSVNAKILLGYVYAHQDKFDKAQQLFVESAKSNPPNIWLWSNWGELLALQHKDDQAIAKYREAISRPVTHDTYDRARKFAYTELLELLQQRKDLDGMESLYKQRVAEYGPGSCYSADYARFMLQMRGNTQAAIDLARGALNVDCEDSKARQILGMAEYVKWAATTGPERADSLNQARIYLPAGPMPLYLLATSDRTSPAIKQLLVAGEQIDQKDNENQTALGYALQNDDLDAARRLLKLQARADTPVGYQNIPLALVPVMEGNMEAIRMLREFGVDYSKLRFRGTTAIDFAKQSGNHDLLEALGRGDTTL